MKQNIFKFTSLAVAIVSVSWLTSCGSLQTAQKAEPPVAKAVEGNSMQTEKETPFACMMNALTPDERKRLAVLTKELMSKKLEITEVPDGYTLRYKMDEETFRNAAEFVTYERKCCPFFDFDLTAKREEGDMLLKLSGREGVKEFIRAEFGI